MTPEKEDVDLYVWCVGSLLPRGGKTLTQKMRAVMREVEAIAVSNNHTYCLWSPQLLTICKHGKEDTLKATASSLREVWSLIGWICGSFELPFISLRSSQLIGEQIDELEAAQDMEEAMEELSTGAATLH